MRRPSGTYTRLHSSQDNTNTTTTTTVDRHQQGAHHHQRQRGEARRWSEAALRHIHTLTLQPRQHHRRPAAPRRPLRQRPSERIVTPASLNKRRVARDNNNNQGNTKERETRPCASLARTPPRQQTGTLTLAYSGTRTRQQSCGGRNTLPRETPDKSTRLRGTHVESIVPPHRSIQAEAGATDDIACGPPQDIQSHGERCDHHIAEKKGRCIEGRSLEHTPLQRVPSRGAAAKCRGASLRREGGRGKDRRLQRPRPERTSAPARRLLRDVASNVKSCPREDGGGAEQSPTAYLDCLEKSGDATRDLAPHPS